MTNNTPPPRKIVFINSPDLGPILRWGDYEPNTGRVTLHLEDNTIIVPPCHRKGIRVLNSAEYINKCGALVQACQHLGNESPTHKLVVALLDDPNLTDKDFNASIDAVGMMTRHTVRQEHHLIPQA